LRTSGGTAVHSTVAAPDLEADVDILERAYRELHPGLLRYLDREQLDRAFRELRREFDRPRTVADAYLAYARFDGRMIVVRDFTSPATLPVGTEIGAIDGIDTRAILARLLPLARADGSNDAKRIEQLNVLGEDLWTSMRSCDCSRNHAERLRWCVAKKCNSGFGGFHWRDFSAILQERWRVPACCIELEMGSADCKLVPRLRPRQGGN
jgi:hypothetical protein